MGDLAVPIECLPCEIWSDRSGHLREAQQSDAQIAVRNVPITFESELRGVLQFLDDHRLMSERTSDERAIDSQNNLFGKRGRCRSGCSKKSK